MKRFVSLGWTALLAVFLLGAGSAVACATCGCGGGRHGNDEAPACRPACDKPCCAGKTSEAEGSCPRLASKACKMKCDKPCPAAEEREAALNTASLKKLLSSDAEVTLLDARSGKWDDGRRIPGAEQLDASASEEEVRKMLPAKDSLVVTYCANTKCNAGPKLAARLKELGYKNVIEYAAGIEGWTSEGNEIVKAD